MLLNMENKKTIYFKFDSSLPGAKTLKELNLLSHSIPILLHILCKHDDSAYNIGSR